MSRGNAISLVIVVAIALIAIAAASILHDGLSSRAKPTALETMLARNARHLAIPAGARKLQNPAAETPENLRDARLHFADHCAICHANDGSGLAARPDRSRTVGSWCASFATCRSLATRSAWRWNATTPKARKISKKNKKRMTSCRAIRCNRNRKGRIIINCGR